MNRKEAAELLPKIPTQSVIRPSKLVISLIGPPKWGKTHFFMSNPDAVLLAFEEGHKFQRGHKMIIDKWDHKGRYASWKDDEGCTHMTFMQAIDALETLNKFDFVIVDTAEMAAKMCTDFHCDKKGVEHIADMGDFGKGYDVGLNTPFRQSMLRLLKTGRGIGFICHTQLEIARFTSGEKARKEARLPKGIKYFVESQSDLILHGEMGKRQEGNSLRDRILVCEGDADTMAGNRSGTMFPERYIVNHANPWKQFQRFFSDPDYAAKSERDYRRALKGK